MTLYDFFKLVRRLKNENGHDASADEAVVEAFNKLPIDTRAAMIYTATFNESYETETGLPERRAPVVQLIKPIIESETVTNRQTSVDPIQQRSEPPIELQTIENINQIELIRLKSFLIKSAIIATLIIMVIVIIVITWLGGDDIVSKNSQFFDTVIKVFKILFLT